MHTRLTYYWCQVLFIVIVPNKKVGNQTLFVLIRSLQDFRKEESKKLFTRQITARNSFLFRRSLSVLDWQGHASFDSLEETLMNHHSLIHSNVHRAWNLDYKVFNFA